MNQDTMVISCSALNCKNRIDSNNGIYFYTYPLKDQELLQKWLDNIQREEFVPTKYSKICSEHFEEQCFRLGSSMKKNLRRGAVPTIFNYEDRFQMTKGQRCRVRRVPSPFVEAIPCVEAVYDEDAVRNRIQKAIDIAQGSLPHDSAVETYSMAGYSMHDTSFHDVLMQREEDAAAMLTQDYSVPPPPPPMSGGVSAVSSSLMAMLEKERGKNRVLAEKLKHSQALSKRRLKKVRDLKAALKEAKKKAKAKGKGKP